jgi:hypothetical protein
MANPILWFGFEQQFHSDFINVLARTILLESTIYKHYTRFHWDLIYRVWGRKRINIKEKPYRITISCGYPKRWSIRIAGTYLSNHGVRWFHSTRNWDLDIASKYSILYKHIAISLVYSAMWGLYLSCNRYLRIGSIVDLTLYFQVIHCEILIIFLFLFYYIFPLLTIVSIYLKNIREILWASTASLLYFIHLKLLRYFFYFKVCEKIYKAHFLYHDIFSGGIGATTWDLKDTPFYRRYISYIYYHSYIITFIIFSIIIIEIFMNQGKVYYSLYLLFLYPLIFSIFRCFCLFGFTNFILDACLSNYIYRNFKNPYYHSRFWFYMANPTLWFGFEQQFHRDLKDVLERTILLESVIYKHYTKFHKDLLFRVWGYRFTTFSTKPYKADIVFTGSPKRWSIRVAGLYLKREGVRWFHSTRVVLSPLPEKIHPLTMYFVKNNPYAILALVNHPSTHFGQLQRVSKKVEWPTAEKMYKNLHPNIIFESKNTSLIETLEVNFVMRFKNLAPNGVLIGTYNSIKNRINYNDLETMQMRPDFIGIWINSIYQYKGVLGIDQKNKSPTNFGRNQVITNPLNEYTHILTTYRINLAFKKHNVSQEMLDVLDLLRDSKDDPDKHIKIWAESLHLFPDKWKPPILLNKTFDESNLTPEMVKLLRKGEAELLRVSDKLYTLKVSEESGSFPKEALDNFEDSDIQRLFGESE